MMRWRGMPSLARDGTLAAGIIAGVLFGLEFVMIYRGILYTTAIRASLFIYLAPFFVALGARWFLPGDRFASCNGRARCSPSPAWSRRSACRRRRRRRTSSWAT